MPQANGRPILHLTVRINNTQYVVGTLRFNKEEFFYFLEMQMSSVRKILNCNSGEMDFSPEHISWHRDVVHVVIKEENNRKKHIDRISYGDNGPLIPAQPIAMPLYVESIYFNEIPPLTPLSDFTPKKGSQYQNILTLDSPKDFSVIFVLCPTHLDTTSMLCGIQMLNADSASSAVQLAILIDENHSPGRIKAWDGWDLVVMTSSFVRTLSSPIPEKLKPGFRLLDYKNVPAALTDLMIQARRRL